MMFSVNEYGVFTARHYASIVYAVVVCLYIYRDGCWTTVDHTRCRGLHSAARLSKRNVLISI